MIPKKYSTAYGVVFAIIIWLIANAYTVLRLNVVDGRPFSVSVFLVTLSLSSLVIFGGLIIGILSKRKTISPALAGSLALVIVALIPVGAGLALYLWKGDTQTAITYVIVGVLFLLWAFWNWFSQ